jgi:S1-C subfamily serine protease
MKPIKAIGFVLRAVTVGLAIAFIVIYLWPSLAARIGNTRDPVTAMMPARAAPFSYAEAVNRAAPAVVSIYTRTMAGALGTPQTNSNVSRIIYYMRQDMGSGVLLSEDGYILTNHHVINQVQGITVSLWDGRNAPAKIVGFDPATDIAVLKVDLDGLPVAPMSDQTEVRVGDVVLAIGNAEGLNNTVTMGIVSATGRIVSATGRIASAAGRNQLNSALYDDFIQTDAAINTGNSGGALVNANGDLIGINTLTLAESTGAQNIGFAIPISLAKSVMQDIIEYGSVRRGWVGATFTDLRPTAQPDGSQARKGIGVQEVYRGGPAWNAGIRQGDVILSLDGEPVDDTNQFLLKVAQSEPGSDVELEVLRKLETFSTYATLIQQPPLP